MVGQYGTCGVKLDNSHLLEWMRSVLSRPIHTDINLIVS